MINDEGDWIRVSSTIEKGERDGTVFPVIDARRIEETEPPENQYIYF